MPTRRPSTEENSRTYEVSKGLVASLIDDRAGLSDIRLLLRTAK